MKKLLSIISSYKELIHYIAEELIHLFIEYLISVLQYVCKLIVSVREVIIFFI